MPTRPPARPGPLSSGGAASRHVSVAEADPTLRGKAVDVRLPAPQRASLAPQPRTPHQSPQSDRQQLVTTISPTVRITRPHAHHKGNSPLRQAEASTGSDIEVLESDQAAGGRLSGAQKRRAQGDVDSSPAEVQPQARAKRVLSAKQVSLRRSD